MNADQIELPGLELNAANGATASALRRAVIETISALHQANLLEPRHAAMCQLALELADAVAAGTRSGRASAAAMAAGQLRETLEALPQPKTEGAEQKFEAWVLALKAAGEVEEKPADAQPPAEQ
jgi:hypothetical protein